MVQYSANIVSLYVVPQYEFLCVSLGGSRRSISRHTEHGDGYIVGYKAVQNARRNHYSFCRYGLQQRAARYCTIDATIARYSKRASLAGRGHPPWYGALFYKADKVANLDQAGTHERTTVSLLRRFFTTTKKVSRSTNSRTDGDTLFCT
mgnify:CR=1 FL=1